MKKADRRGRQQSEDEKAQSRIQLKNKLNFVSEEFNISRLTDSLNEHRANNMFPQINEPTLEFKDTEQSHHLKLEDESSLDRDDPEGLTARLSYQERSGSQLFLLEERVETLARQLQEKNEEVTAGRRRAEMAQKEAERTQKQLDRLRKDLQRKNEVIEGLEKELGSLRLKQSSSDYDSRNSYSNSKSLIEESLHNFCPQLLSPEETVQLLNQLLKKVSKSSKMMRSLTSDVATKEIITKINKN